MISRNRNEVVERFGRESHGYMFTIKMTAGVP